MSFGAPLVLLGLLVLPALAVLLAAQQRRRGRALAAFTTPALAASALPRRPGPRGVIPLILAGLALALLIAAVAKPRVRVTEAVRGATVMLANDVSDSMTSTDVSPSRLAAAQKAAITFTVKVPDTVQIGSVKFARQPTLLQSPRLDHALARQAIASLTPGGGGTAIGEAIQAALAAIRTAPEIAHQHPPGAIVLLSDGTSNVGIPPQIAAAEAKRQHVEVDTIAIGTAHGTERDRTKTGTHSIPVPVNPTELRQIAAASGGRFYAAPNAASAQAIYTALAKRLGHRRVKQGLTAEFAGAGLLLLLGAGGLSLAWFGRLA